MVMCGDIELKERIRQSLDQHQEVKEIFGASLNDRMERDSWLENILIQRLLGQGLSAFEDLIRTAKSALTNFETFKNKLPQGKDKDFDGKMSDWCAELRAIEVLQKKGFTEIASIPEAKSKTIDFKAGIGTEIALIEVKHKREPIETQIIRYLTTKLSEEHLKYPSIYKYSIWISSGLLHPLAKLGQRDIQDVLRKEIEDIVPKIIECLREGDFSKLPKTQNIEVLQRHEPPLSESVLSGITLEIKIVICTGKQEFSVSDSPGDLSIDAAAWLEDLVERMRIIVEEAKNQLEGHRPIQHGRKFVLVFVDLKPGLFLVDEKIVKAKMEKNLKGVKDLKIRHASDMIIFLELNDRHPNPA